MNQRLASDSSAATLRAAGLLDLRSHANSRAALDRAVSLLERARRRGPNAAPLLNDLAVTYVEVATRDQALLPMIQALDMVDGAIRTDSTLMPALFNRALILEQLHLVSSAEQAWKTYLSSEYDDAWKGEAQAHLRALMVNEDTLTARLYPQQARERLFGILGDWGAAMERRDTPRADSLLAIGRVMRDSVRTLGADRSVVAAVDALETLRRDPIHARSVGRALVAFSDGITAHDNSQYEKCETSMLIAERTLRVVSTPIARWASFYRAACEMNQAKYDQADRRLRGVIGSASKQEEAVVGKAIWVRGAIALRRGNHEAASRLYAESRRHFLRAKDAQNEAAVSYLLTESLALAGQSEPSLAEGYRGLRDMAPLRQSNYLHNHLITIASFARSSGYRLAALDFLGEALAIDQALKRLNPLAFALWTRADDFASLGDTARAMSDLNAAAAVASRLEGVRRARTMADIDFVRARLVAIRDPAAASSILSGVGQTYRTLKAWIYLPAALYQSALIARRQGDTALARARLSEAIDEIERQRGSFGSVASRASFYETTEGVFDAAIGIELDAGRTDAAFRLLERARVPLWTSRLVPARNAAVAKSATIAGIGCALPRNMLFITYAVLEDRVAIWFSSCHGSGARTVGIARDTVASLVARMVGPGSRRRTAGVEPSVRLFDLLLAPLASELSGVHGLIVAPDRELARIPFAALRDARTGRYVVEDYSVRTVPSAGFVLAAASIAAARQQSTASSALVVGNPLVDSGDSERLPTLPGAGIEALRVAGVRPRSLLLTGREAQRDAVLATLGEHSVFHFAGHAVFNEAQPDLSYLALGPSDGNDGRLYAREIAELRLSNLRIVVLSACSTLNARASRNGAMAGLAYSFLRAGVPAIVSTLWETSDDTSMEVLVEFHRLLAQGDDAADALRGAQLHVLASARQELHSPAVWAGFIYTGP